jgi:hypothetical protein
MLLLWIYPMTMVIICIYYIIHSYLLDEVKNIENSTHEEREAFLSTTQEELEIAEPESPSMTYDSHDTPEDSSEEFIIVQDTEIGIIHK